MIRVFIDGDGTINRNDIRFVFNSKPFALQIINFFEKEFNKYYGIIEDFRYTLTEIQGKTVKYYRLRLPMGKGRRNYMSIYYIIMQQFFLKRKRNNFNKK